MWKSFRWRLFRAGADSVYFSVSVDDASLSKKRREPITVEENAEAMSGCACANALVSMRVLDLAHFQVASVLLPRVSFSA